MAEIVQMPKLGFDMKEGVLVRWVKMEGESVQKGDVLAEIETDKATVEVELSFSGNLYKQLVDVDAIVPIGDPIAVIADPDEKVDLNQLVGKKEKKSDGDSSNEIPEEKTESVDEPEFENTGSEERIKASPLARRIAEENQVKLSEISGTGPGGRIVKKDVELAIESGESEKSSEVKQQTGKSVPEKKDDQGQSLPVPGWNASGKQREDVRVPANKLRQAISRRMVESKQQIPHFYATYNYNVAALMELRKQTNATLPDLQKLSLNDFIIKAVALTLLQYPNLNASLDEKIIVQHKAVNIGVAVAVEGGLLTVVVKDADIKPIRLISSEVKEMAARVRSGKVRADDVDGSTFSISNLGMYGVDEFSAIINPPEAGILAVSAAQKTPVVENGELAIGWRMKATISADHRITDGAEAAEFMKSFAFQIENPIRLLL